MRQGCLEPPMHSACRIPRTEVLMLVLEPLALAPTSSHEDHDFDSDQTRFADEGDDDDDIHIFRGTD